MAFNRNSYCKKPIVVDASAYVSGVGTEDTEMQALAVAVRAASEGDEYDAGTIVDFPAGTFTVTANNQNETGINWIAGVGRHIHFRGAGQGQTILKRADSATLGPDSQHHTVYQREGTKYSFRGLTIDDNEQNMPDAPEGDSFFYEHCGGLKLFSINDGTIDYIELVDVEFTNAIADGYHGNAQIRRYKMVYCNEGPRDDRVRAGASHTYVPSIMAEHSNNVMTSLENEPHLQPTEGSRYIVKNMHISGAWDMNRCFLEADNVTQLSTEGVGLPFCNLYQLGAGSYIRNSSFRDVRRIQECYGLDIEDCVITCVDNDGVTNEVDLWMEGAGTVTLRRCTMVTETVGNGGMWFKSAEAFAGDLSPTAVFENLTIPKNLEYFLGGATQGGTFKIIEGNIGASIGIIAASSSSAERLARVEMTVNNTWTGNLIAFSTTFLGPVTIVVTGTFDADNLTLADRALPGSPNLTVDASGLRGTKTTPPDGSYQGLPGVVIESGGNEYAYDDGWVNNGPPVEA